MKVRRFSPLGGALALALVISGAALADEPAGGSFQQIYAAPDDPAGNFAYARAEARAGNLLAAAAALERILLAAPNENGVRLFYVAVLYRLNDLQGAQQQLNALDESKLSPLQKREADKYRTLIAQGRSDFHYYGYVGTGLTTDSDVLGALHTQFDFFGGSVAKKPGQTFLAQGKLDASKELNEEGDLSVFGTGTIYSRTSIGGPNADYLNGEVDLGLTGYGLHYNWQAGGVYRNYQIVDSPYLTEYGGSATFNYMENTSLTWIAGFEAVGQNFHEPFVDRIATFLGGTHDGARYDMRAGAAYRFDSQRSISGVFGYEIKTAGYEPFAYDSPYFDGDFHSLLGGGGYFDLSGEMRFVNYRKADQVFLLGARREDMRGYVRMAMGAPLSAFTQAKATGDFRERLLVEGAITYDERTSRHPIAPYSDLGFVMRVIWKFGESR
ncbi:MAG TPA: hypothetical protein VKB71_18665 [Rhizomicrobium sp.]|nr:hypothetical protein [Rhizomicrobium sp.]